MANEVGVLHLSNGICLKGTALGAPIIRTGELVFTTGMVGYTQTLTDPSFYGQILVFTYPLMGNYGVPGGNDLLDELNGLESDSIKVAGVVLSQTSEHADHWASHQTLEEWFKKNSIPALMHVDTRYLAQTIREGSGLLAAIGPASSFEDWNQQFYNPNSQNILPRVSTPERRIIGRGRQRVALVDCGVKWNIVRQLVKLGCEIELLPWDTDFSTVDCSGWLISNGPGDPQNTGDLISRVTTILDGSKPVLGICLGFQLMALAAGASTRKLRFGHRGHNQPVQLMNSQRGFISSQNHGFEVIEKTLPPNWEPWFRHINDNTLEGIKHKFKPMRGVQFHPEAAAGPQDTSWIIHDFVGDLK